jgi:PQQ-dependent catabolism-associated beta-propeller protein
MALWRRDGTAVRQRRRLIGAGACLALAWWLVARALAAPGVPHDVQPDVRPGVRLYVSNEELGEVVVVDPEAGTVLSRISVGKRPRGIKLSRDGKQLYVALSGSPRAAPGIDESTLPPPDRSADGIGVVDLASGKLVRTYPSGQDPECFDLSPDGKRLYVSNEETAEMSVLDLRKGKIIRKVKVGGEPEGVTVRPDGKVVYVTCEQDNAVAAVDTSSFKVLAHIETGARPRAIAFTADGHDALVTAENTGQLTVLDARAHKPLTSIAIVSKAGKPLPPRPMGIVLSPDGKLAYVSNGRGESIAVIDVQKRTLVRMIESVGARPWGIAVSADGRTLYTANGPSEDVSVVDAGSGKVHRRVKIGGLPWGVVVAR